MKAKRVYFDLRLGGITLNPVIALSNFLMLSYLIIEDVIPFWLFVPLFIVGIFVLYSFVGNKFRNIQYTTDSNMIYEKSTEQAQTLLLIMQRLKNQDNINDPIFDKRIEYMKQIVNKKL